MTEPPRSTNPDDYQRLPRRVAALAKRFPSGHEIAPHDHPRDQLLYAVTGVMRIRTEAEAWIAPPDRAVYMPARLRHSVSIRGDLEMRTLYIEPDAAPGLPRSPAVLEMSDLLRALVLALFEEPVLYDEAGRGGAVERLLLLELAAADALPFVAPMPSDPRLRRVCDALLADPQADITLEGWAERAGASARTLARLCRQQLGMGFDDWRRRVRFQNAIEALAAGAPIGRVARQNGYRSASAFSAAFRRTMGAAPSEIRTKR